MRQFCFLCLSLFGTTAKDMGFRPLPIGPQPKRTKFRKMQKGRVSTIPCQSSVDFGDYGLKVLEPCKIKGMRILQLEVGPSEWWFGFAVGLYVPCPTAWLLTRLCPFPTASQLEAVRTVLARLIKPYKGKVCRSILAGWVACMLALPDVGSRANPGPLSLHQLWMRVVGVAWMPALPADGCAGLLA